MRTNPPLTKRLKVTTKCRIKSFRLKEIMAWGYA
jgi:hypothetical protein